MKVLAKGIEMVSWINLEGIITPVRFKIENEDSSNSVVKIDKVITVDKERLAGNNMLLYTCQSVIRGSERIFSLKYSYETCKWMLWKL
ncbi:type II toxin-antitoxin system PemK/MazF family toxin [Clostridium estertheticum]|uniref:type II toxin-antitoxin system PemK/MazF family toxin n=1 Tax=Clostridium estertheticum TaxID=238834 RepID=UPI001C0B813D|nr:type II toxin-antitoxin system PemK/MazF family toxin [Clostridium estertheticum]MBU3172756.1 type II toxin-antitoxin system PemK/MazF family toxin [Clostridium estertheticum]